MQDRDGTPLAFPPNSLNVFVVLRDEKGTLAEPGFIAAERRNIRPQLLCLCLPTRTAEANSVSTQEVAPI